MDSLGGDCGRSMQAVQDYLVQLAAHTPGRAAPTAQNFHQLALTVHRQTNGTDCGLFATGNIGKLASADYAQLLERLNATTSQSTLTLADSCRLFSPTTQREASAQRRALRDQLCALARDHGRPPASPGWGAWAAPGRWFRYFPTWRECRTINRTITTVHQTAALADPSTRCLMERSSAGVPLTEQDLTRLYIHPDPRDSYLNDPLVDWVLYRMANDGVLSPRTLVYGGRFLARFLRDPHSAAGAAFARVARWTRGTDPLQKQLLFFLDNQVADHWRLVVAVNPGALLGVPTSDSGGLRSAAPPGPLLAASPTPTTESPRPPETHGPILRLAAGGRSPAPPSSPPRPAVADGGRNPDQVDVCDLCNTIFFVVDVAPHFDPVRPVCAECCGPLPPLAASGSAPGPARDEDDRPHAGSGDVPPDAVAVQLDTADVARCHRPLASPAPDAPESAIASGRGLSGPCSSAERPSSPDLRDGSTSVRHGDGGRDL